MIIKPVCLARRLTLTIMIAVTCTLSGQAANAEQLRFTGRTTADVVLIKDTLRHIQFIDSCASRFDGAHAVRDAHKAVQRSDLRLIKIIKEAVVVTVEAPGLSAISCANAKRLTLEDDATSRLISEGNFKEDSQPTACEEAAREYAAIYSREIVKFRPKVLADFCTGGWSVR